MNKARKGALISPATHISEIMLSIPQAIYTSAEGPHRDDYHLIAWSEELDSYSSILERIARLSKERYPPNFIGVTYSPLDKQGTLGIIAIRMMNGTDQKRSARYYCHMGVLGKKEMEQIEFNPFVVVPSLVKVAEENRTQTRFVSQNLPCLKCQIPPELVEGSPSTHALRIASQYGIHYNIALPFIRQIVNAHLIEKRRIIIGVQENSLGLANALISMYVALHPKMARKDIYFSTYVDNPYIERDELRLMVVPQDILLELPKPKDDGRYLIIPLDEDQPIDVQTEFSYIANQIKTAIQPKVIRRLDPLMAHSLRETYNGVIELFLNRFELTPNGLEKIPINNIMENSFTIQITLLADELSIFFHLVKRLKYVNKKYLFNLMDSIDYLKKAKQSKNGNDRSQNIRNAAMHLKKAIAPPTEVVSNRKEKRVECE